MPQDYSQFGEQATILEWASHAREPGSFLDVGAYDGQTLSNTAALRELGWRGVLIEPAPDAAAACRLRTDEGCVVVACALTLESSAPAILYWTPGQPYSSLDRAHARSMTDSIVPLIVGAFPIAQLALRSWPEPLFLSIDAEGSTLELVEALLEALPVYCVCLEAHAGAERELAHELLEGWTLLAETDVNVIAVRR